MRFACRSNRGFPRWLRFEPAVFIGDDDAPNGVDNRGFSRVRGWWVRGAAGEGEESGEERRAKSEERIASKEPLNSEG